MIHSASSLTLWTECRRKFGYRYFDGIKPPPNESAERGTQAHAKLAAYLSGDPTELPAWLQVGVPHLPAPGTCKVEGEFTFALRGHRFIGYKDVEILDRLPPLVLDHKTTKNLRYAKRPEQLRTDFQAALYAADAMVRAQSTECDIAWVYYRYSDDEPKALPVAMRLKSADVEPVLERAIAIADEVEQLIQLGAKAKDLPPNYETCSKYGGCPYIELCSQEPLLMGAQETLDALKAKAAKGINPPPPPAAKPPPPPPPPAPLVGGRVTTPPMPPPPKRETIAEVPMQRLTKAEYVAHAIVFEEIAALLRAKAATL